MSTSPTYFTGSSAYSQDFQNVVNRAVQIASLPINLLTNQQTTLTNQNTELKTIDGKFAALQTAIQGIQKALSGSSFQASVSNPSVVSASMADGATEGVYTIKVNSLGAYAKSLTAQSWNNNLDPSGKPATYTLTVGSKEFNIQASDNNASSVASAINSQYGNLVRATVIDLGSNGNHDYRISLQSTTLGATTLDLSGPPPGLQSQMAPVDNHAVSQTTNAWDASGDPVPYVLVIDGNEYDVAPTDNSLDSVVSAINSSYGSLVTATKVNVAAEGDPPDYRLRLESQSEGVTTLDLQKNSPVSLQSTQDAGSLASYELQNSGVVITSSSRTVTVGTGVSLTMLATSTSPVDVTVTRSTSVLSTAMSSFVDAYNAAVDELAAQKGQNGGPLQGQSIVSTLSRALGGLATYSDSSNAIGSLANLGLSLEVDGHITFNSYGLMASDIANSAGVTSFFGSATSGGFLKAATDALNGLENPTTGLIKTSETAYQNQIASLGNTIATRQDQVNQLQIRLQNQMAQADALIASMEQQYTYMSNMFAAQQSADQMYK